MMMMTTMMMNGGILARKGGALTKLSIRHAATSPSVVVSPSIQHHPHHGRPATTINFRNFASPSGIDFSHSSRHTSSYFSPSNLITVPRIQYSLGFVIVPQAEKWVIERLGKFHRTLESGFHFLIPVLDKIRYVHSMKETAFEISNQTAITSDNVAIQIDGILYLQIHDPHMASYRIDHPVFAASQLAQTTMRVEIGKITLDQVFAERERLNENIVRAIAKVCEGWGLEVKRYEIRDISVPTVVRNSMDLIAEAERRKRKAILDAEAESKSQATVAEGHKRAVQLNSEASFTEQVNLARGEAEAIRQRANATAESLERLSSALMAPRGLQAVSLRLAEQYIQAFSKIAQRGNTVVVPANTADAASMIAQALSVFGTVSQNTQRNSSSLSRDQALERLGEEIGFDVQSRPHQEVKERVSTTLGELEDLTTSISVDPTLPPRPKTTATASAPQNSDTLSNS